VACGVSCRHQLHDFLGVRARHWVEVVRPEGEIGAAPGGSQTKTTV